MNQVLFLHWGPGGNCGIERHFGRCGGWQLWDQPRVPELSTAHALSDLEQTAVAQVRTTARDSLEKQVDLVAHSFGAQLALYLMAHHPDLIGDVTLLAPSVSASGAIVSLARHLSRSRPGMSRLDQLADRYLQTLEPQDFWAMASEIQSRCPDSIVEYWGAASKTESGCMARALGYLGAHSDALDMGTFGAIMTESLERTRAGRTLSAAELAGFKGRIHIILGREDVLAPVGAEARKWSALLPGAEMTFVESGHFPHLELVEIVDSMRSRESSSVRKSSERNSGMTGVAAP